jgi:signal peptidase I
MNIWIKRIIKAIAIWLLLIMIYLTLNLWFNVIFQLFRISLAST